MNRWGKKWILRGMSKEGLLRPARGLFLRRKTLVLMYHEVLEDDREIEAWTVVKETEFRRQMEYLKRNFQVIGLPEALQLMLDPGPVQGNHAVVTFDDGYSGNRRVAFPILESLGIPASIFVATGAVENQALYWYDRVILEFQDSSVGVQLDLEPMRLNKYTFPKGMAGENRWEQIRKLLEDLKALPPDDREKAVAGIQEQTGSDGGSSSRDLAPLSYAEIRELAESRLITFGAHSHSHEILVQIGPEEIRKSIGQSRELLGKWTERKIRHFSYPNGNYNAEVMAMVKGEGFECALTTESRPWALRDSAYSIPRIGIGRYDGVEIFKAKVSGIVG